MLKINVGFDFKDDCVISIDYYFKQYKTKEWFNTDIVKKIIKGIDNTIAVKDEYLESPIFGGMSPERLSTGCKAVILMAMTDMHIYATRCGDNCVPYILEVAKTKDVEITLHHCMRFPKDGWEALIIETGKIVHSRKEFVNEYYKISSTFKYL